MFSMTDYLYHHGIKGQKWGVENGPPYPLTDTVKAIAYRGGTRSDGTKVENFTKKDVKKARKIVNKNLSLLTKEEMEEYKSRLLLERSVGDILGTGSASKFKKNMKESIMNSISDSVKASGTKVLTNAEMAAVGKILETAFDEDVASMITNGLSSYDIRENRYKKFEAERKHKEKAAETRAKILGAKFNRNNNDDDDDDDDDD